MKEYTDCAEVREELSALLDEELSAEEQTAIENHLSDCSECLRELEALQQVTKLYGNLPVPSVPDELLASIHNTLDPDTVEFDPSSRMTRRMSYRPVAMAAAMLALMAGVSYMISQGLGTSRYDEDTLAKVPAAIQMESMSMEEKEADYWGDEAPQVKNPEPDMDSPEIQQRIQLLEDLKNKKIVSKVGEMESRSMTLEFSADGVLKQSSPEKKRAEELTNQFTISEGGLWTEKGYTGQPLTELAPGSSEYLSLLFTRPYLVNLTRHTRDIIFSYKGKWYSFSHEGPLMRDPVLGDPHPKSRKLITSTEAVEN